MESASQMVGVWERRKDISAESISRSESSIWPESWAVVISIAVCNSGERSAVCDGRVESALMRI